MSSSSTLTSVLRKELLQVSQRKYPKQGFQFTACKRRSECEQTAPLTGWALSLAALGENTLLASGEWYQPEMHQCDLLLSREKKTHTSRIFVEPILRCPGRSKHGTFLPYRFCAICGHIPLGVFFLKVRNETGRTQLCFPIPNGNYGRR